MRVNNTEALWWVVRRKVFEGGNISSSTRYTTGLVLYTVWSYCTPQFIALRKGDGEYTWYENKDPTTSTTRKHRELLRPTPDTIKVSEAQMQRLCREGVIPNNHPLAAVFQ